MFALSGMLPLTVCQNLLFVTNHIHHGELLSTMFNNQDECRWISATSVDRSPPGSINEGWLTMCCMIIGQPGITLDQLFNISLYLLVIGLSGKLRTANNITQNSSINNFPTNIGLIIILIHVSRSACIFFLSSLSCNTLYFMYFTHWFNSRQLSLLLLHIGSKC